MGSREDTAQAGSQSTGSISGIRPDTSGTWTVSLDHMAKKLTTASRGNREKKGVVKSCRWSRRWATLRRKLLYRKLRLCRGGWIPFQAARALNCRDQECIEDIGMYVTIFERVRFSSKLHYFILFLFVDARGNTNYYTLNRFLKY